MRKLWVLLACAASALAADKPLTFTHDVAPILYQHCVKCHRPGEVAPMSLLDYKSARPWARSMREAVPPRRMPPWMADPHFGTFSNDPSLKPEEIAVITKWVDAGAPEGNAADLPQPP